ncbi:MAG: hypothetical protein O7E52_23130 [Candidatus Poribacteria bacterium]|nr:hypothetical protein [Candidatus Poribacteria bacterium]
MVRQCYIFTLILSYFALGCGSAMLNALVSAQEWSENYATLEGTTCGYSAKDSQIPVPEMIDGDLETVGRAGREIILTLPTRKSIHRVVIRGTNIEDVILYAGLGGEGNWRKVKQLKNNRESTIDLRVSFVTDRIRLRVGGTFDDQRIAGAYSAQRNAIISQRKLGSPTAQEIELYGFVDKKTQKSEGIEAADTPTSTESPEDIEAGTTKF